MSAEQIRETVGTILHVNSPLHRELLDGVRGWDSVVRLQGSRHYAEIALLDQQRGLLTELLIICEVEGGQTVVISHKDGHSGTLLAEPLIVRGVRYITTREEDGSNGNELILRSGGRPDIKISKEGFVGGLIPAPEIQTVGPSITPQE